jgi:acyl-CoA thioester hydrolase
LQPNPAFLLASLRMADHDKPYQGSFEGGVHRFALRVYFEDTDAGGVVYYANYLKFMERARSDMLRALGIEQRKALESGEGVYAVTAVSIRYRSSARLDDDLLIISEVQQVRGASCVIQQRVMRSRELLAEASVTVAFLSPDGRPKRQPRAWVEKFEQITISEANDR